MSEAVRSRAPEQLSPYEAVLRSFGYSSGSPPRSSPWRGPAWNWRCARRRAMPMPGRCWRCCAARSAEGSTCSRILSARSAARRAVEAAPSNPLAWFSSGPGALLSRRIRELPERGGAGRRTQSHGRHPVEFLGEPDAYAGDWSAAARGGTRKQLNPQSSRMVLGRPFLNAYRQGDDRGARLCAQDQSAGPLGLRRGMAAACGQLGERDAAEKPCGSC